jgi:hypothetical protein
MSIVDRVKTAGTTVAEGGKRQARRAQLELQNRQAERKLNREYARIGKALCPLLQNGDLSTDNAEVRAAIDTIEALQGEHDDRQREIDRVVHPEVIAPAAIEESSATGQ